MNGLHLLKGVSTVVAAAGPRAAALLIGFGLSGAFSEEALAEPGDLLLTLNSPSPVSGDRFGNSVAIDGDLMVVGAPFDDSSGVEDAGTAYVFDADNGALVAILDNPTPAANDQFGSDGNGQGNGVAIDGNLVVVGARHHAVAEQPGRVCTRASANDRTGERLKTGRHCGG